MGEPRAHRTRRTGGVVAACLGVCLLAACTEHPGPPGAPTAVARATGAAPPATSPAPRTTSPAPAASSGAPAPTTSGPDASGPDGTGTTAPGTATSAGSTTSAGSGDALAAATGVSRWVTAAALNVRTGPSTARRAVATLHRGAKVTVLTTSAGWSKIRRGGGTAWVASRYLTATKPQRVVDRIARHYGVDTVVYAKTSVCGRFTTGPAQGGLLGCFELAHPDRIKVAAWMKGYTTLSAPSLGRTRAATTARHETAHELIRRACGTAVPGAAGKRIEHVTDAYAHLYVGATEAYYGYTAKDLRTARALHAGRCG